MPKGKSTELSRYRLAYYLSLKPGTIIYTSYEEMCQLSNLNRYDVEIKRTKIKAVPTGSSLTLIELYQVEILSNPNC